MTYDESFRKDDEDTTPLHMLNAFFVCLKIHPKNHKVKTVNKSHNCQDYPLITSFLGNSSLFVISSFFIVQSNFKVIYKVVKINKIQ